MLCQRGEGDLSTGKDAARKFIDPALERFETETDRDFFDGLWEEMREPGASRGRIYRRWLKAQVARALYMLSEAPRVLPHPSSRSYWNRTQSSLAFRAVLAKSSAFKPVLQLPKAEEGLHAVH